MYEIKFLPRAEKYIKKLKDKNLKEKLKMAIYKIEQNPYIRKVKKGDLSTIYGFHLFYNKTNYEISYKIYSEKTTVVIILIGTRENFYEELKKYFNS